MSENMKKENEKLPKYEFLLSGRLDNALKLAEISQNELSKMLAVHPTTVTNWKKEGKNKKGVPMNILKKIADILECDIEYLYIEEHNLPDLSFRKNMEESQSFVKDFNSLFDYLLDRGYSLQYSNEERTVAIIDTLGKKHYFDENSMKKFDAKLQAHINYELINNGKEC